MECKFKYKCLPNEHFEFKKLSCILHTSYTPRSHTKYIDLKVLEKSLLPLSLL